MASKIFISFFICLFSLSNVFAEGTIERYEMPTASALNNRPIQYYIPECYYKDDTTSYPVLYLFHGVNGDERSWVRDGNIQYVLDSMIENHIIKPCIVVMPNTNSGKYIWGKGDKSTLAVFLGYFKNRRGNFKEYFQEIEFFSDSLYRISHIPSDRAIAGLSNGAMQAANLSNMYPGQYAYVGLFSPVIFKGQVPVMEEEWCINPSLPHGTTFWIGIGNGDVFRKLGLKYAEYLRKAHIPCVVVKHSGGHNWGVWKEDIEKFIYAAFAVN